MIKKNEKCLYCGEKMESITAKKRFCSDKCRVYASRLKKVLIDATIEQTKKYYDIDSLPKKSQNEEVSSYVANADVKKEEKPLKKPENEPREGTLAFFRKYGVLTYAEIDNNS